MIVLDTNVVSEFLKPDPHPTVLSWADGIPVLTFAVAAPTIYEIEFGIGRLAAGRRRDSLTAGWRAFLDDVVQHRVLSVDHAAAEWAARRRLAMISEGRSADLCDYFIAGIASIGGHTIATRNIRHFSGLSVPVVDPWSSG